MAAIVRSEFALAIKQIATERGIDPEVVFESIKAAILAAYRKDYGKKDEDGIEVMIDKNSGETHLIKEGQDVTPAGFGRIATQTAKQVILQRIREAEKRAIIDDFSSRVGTIVNGIILRFDKGNVIADIGRAQAVMPPAEQISSEHYRLNQKLVFYIKDIKKTIHGNEVIVSRSDPGLVAALFKREVPEVANNSVVVKKIAREAGSRTKIAVESSQSGVDPVGSCVGQKGVRVQAVISELGGQEKIDIIQFSDNPQFFIQTTLSPADDVEVILDEKNKKAVAYISEDQLSLAIGKDGQNVRLASKLTSWKIDIKAKEQKEEKEGKEKKKEKEKAKEKKTKKTEGKKKREEKEKKKGKEK